MQVRDMRGSKYGKVVYARSRETVNRLDKFFREKGLRPLPVELRGSHEAVQNVVAKAKLMVTAGEAKARDENRELTRSSGSGGADVRDENLARKPVRLIAKIDLTTTLEEGEIPESPKVTEPAIVSTESRTRLRSKVSPAAKKHKAAEVPEEPTPMQTDENRDAEVKASEGTQLALVPEPTPDVADKSDVADEMRVSVSETEDEGEEYKTAAESALQSLRDDNVAEEGDVADSGLGLPTWVREGLAAHMSGAEFFLMNGVLCHTVEGVTQEVKGEADREIGFTTLKAVRSGFLTNIREMAEEMRAPAGTTAAALPPMHYYKCKQCTNKVVEGCLICPFCGNVIDDTVAQEIAQARLHVTASLLTTSKAGALKRRRVEKGLPARKQSTVVRDQKKDKRKERKMLQLNPILEDLGFPVYKDIEEYEERIKEDHALHYAHIAACNRLSELKAEAEVQAANRS
jgi:hypothetical protein